MGRSLHLLAGLLLLSLVAPTLPVRSQPGERSAQAEDSVPTLTYRVPGLEAPAEILVDTWGVPHLYAQSLYEVFFVQGFNAARDRLWQLDLWKRRGDGTLSQVLGREYVEKDRAARLFFYRGDMHAEWLAYASDTKRIVTAFVDGINAYIRLTEEQPDLLPFEFELLDYRPALWTPETVVRIRSHGLLRNAGSEVSRARFLRRHGEGALRFRERLEPDHELQVPPGLDLEAIPEDVLRVYRLGTGGVSFAAQRPDELARTGSPPDLLTVTSRGSNNWALAPSRTATGRPILADDPHRQQAVPSLRYITHLSAPGLDVIGAGEPALPGISIGHNGRIAFGLTIFSIDQEDIYLYETNPRAPEEYRYRGRWEPMEVITEEIPVRGAAPVAVRLKFTRHGPVLYEDPSGHRAVALRAAWLEPGMAPYLGSIEYMRARNWDEFLAAMNRWGSPSENQVYADTAGNIGWKPGGLAPIRPNWDGLLPVPGDGRYEWAGFRDMDTLPVEYNPERGWVASANQMNLPPDYPHALGYEWRLPYRFGRIREVLEDARGATLEDSLRLQGDYLSLPARRVLAVLEGVATEDRKVGQALDLLRDWDAVLTPESPAAALFEVWFRRYLSPAVLANVVSEPATRQALGGGNTEVVLSLLEAPSGDPGSESGETRNQAIRASLGQAIVETEELLGTDWSRWRWGDLHHIVLHHPLSSRMPEELRATTDVGPAPRGGNGDTVGNTSYRRSDFRQISGASFRMVVDVGQWDNSLAMNNPGQSGDPKSPHYRDLFPLWAKDQAIPLLYSRERVVAATRQRIELVPAAEGD